MRSMSRWAALSAAILVILTAGSQTTAAGGLPGAARLDHRTSVRPAAEFVHYRRQFAQYHHYEAGDPYAYRYEPRGYYPYYGAGYWKHGFKPARPNFKRPPYYAAWGYERRWHNRSWHRAHHGRHWPWHW